MKSCFACGFEFEDISWLCPKCSNKPKLANSFISFVPASKGTEKGFKSSYFKQLFDIETDSFWFCSRNSLIIWLLQRYFPQAKNFFEIGCGTGFVLNGIKNAFPTLSLCGGDIYIEGLNYAKKRLGKIELFRMDARRIPFKEEFDLVGVFDVLEHVQEDELVLAQIHKALHNKGGVIITVPQHMFLWSSADERDCHFRRYSIKELRKKIESKGFTIIDVISFNSLLLPAMALERFFKKIFRKKCSTIEDLRVNKITNSFFKIIMGLELYLIRFGLRLPFGGSLAVIAEK